MLKVITLAHFSPTGGTRKAALSLAQKLAIQIEEIDFSLPQVTNYVFKPTDITIFAVPVYGGRIPVYVLECLNACSGNGAKAVSAVAYGGRAYDDALLELNDSLIAQGFDILASATLLVEHSMFRSVAAGRPDHQDQRQFGAFAKAIIEKLEKKLNTAVVVSGNCPYRTWNPLPVVPVASDVCDRCGLCAKKCPMLAIPKDKPNTTLLEKCILCMRCVSVCPNAARALPVHVMEIMQQKLSSLQGTRKENELFL